MSSSPSTGQALEPAVLVTRLLAATGSTGVPFSSFESMLRDARGEVEPLADVSFDVYAGDVVYSNEIRAGLDEALARDWVRFLNRRLVVTDDGIAALEQRGAAPPQREREAITKLVA